MKYLISIFLFLLSTIIFFIFNIKGIVFWEGYLISSTLLFLITKDSRLYYSFGAISGLFIDSFTAIFGLHAIVFIIILFILNILKNQILGAKNILTILLLISISFILYYFFTFLYYIIFSNLDFFKNIYDMFYIIKSVMINTLITIVLYLLHYNINRNGRSF